MAWLQRLVPILLLSLGPLVGCSSLKSNEAGGKADVSTIQSAPGNTWLRTELYFGMNKPGGEVSEREWQLFVQDEITPRFPEGITLLKGDGQWRDSSGQIQREGSHLLILLHPPDRAVNERIEQLRRIYCARFQQASVLRVTSWARVSFDAQKP